MRVVRALPEVFMWALIIAMALFNLAVFTDVVEGENAADSRAQVIATTTSGTAIGGEATATAIATAGPSDRAELDDSEALPGQFFASQGRQHTSNFPLRTHVPFCPPRAISNECYASNPPTSGLHLPVQGTVRLSDGNRLKIPPDPGVYDFAIPREAIPHIEEHAGVYIGYNCASDGCGTTVERLKDLVTQEISLGARVVLSPDDDLDGNTIGVAAWTRLDVFGAADYSDDRVRSFVKAHSCRFDPEHFCKTPPIN